MTLPDLQGKELIDFFILQEIPKLTGGQQKAFQRATRQVVVAHLLAQGYNYSQIAQALQVKWETVERDVEGLLGDVQHFAGRTIKAWFDQQLRILERQITQTVADIDQTVEMKEKNMLRRTLVKLMEQQDRLLRLSAKRVEVDVRQTVDMVAIDLGGLAPEGYDIIEGRLAEGTE